jgi:hypothetical protein
MIEKNILLLNSSGGARGWQEGAEPHPERFEPPLESFETRIEIRKSYVMSAFLGAQPPPEYFLGAEPPLELFSGSATGFKVVKFLSEINTQATIAEKLERISCIDLYLFYQYYCCVLMILSTLRLLHLCPRNCTSSHFHHSLMTIMMVHLLIHIHHFNKHSITLNVTIIVDITQHVE